MTHFKGMRRKATIGMVTAAMTMSMFGTALAAPVETYGTAATAYGNADTDRVSTWKNPNGDTVSVPSAQDRASIRVYGVDAGATVKAYHLIEGNYNQQGFTGWTQTAGSAAVEGGKFDSFHSVVDNVEQVVAIVNDKSDPDYNKGLIIREQNVSKIANAIINGNLTAVETKDAITTNAQIEAITLTQDETGAYYTNEAEAGTYLILVESENKGVIYNPMIVSNDYAHANDATSLSNVKQTHNPAGTGAVAQTTSTHALAAYGYGDSERGVQDDATNSYTDYSFTLESKKDGLDVSESVAWSPVGTGNNVDTYDTARTDVTYYRDVEANGNVYALSKDGTDAATYNSETGKWTPETGVKTMALLGRAYAKKSTIGLEKNIVAASTNDGQYCKYEDVKKGDTVTFDLYATIPDYSDIYFKDVEIPQGDYIYKIVDNQSVGITLPATGKVKVYAAYSDAVTAEAVATDIVKEENLLTDGTQYTFSSDAGSNSITIGFDKDWVMSADNANKKVVVRYDATVNENAISGLDGNYNEVFLDYVTNPKGAKGHKFDFSMIYTFTPTVAKVAEEGSVTWPGTEGTKNVVTIEEVTDPDATDSRITDAEAVEATTTVDKPLADAKFRLVRIGDREGVNNEGKYTMNLASASNGKEMHELFDKDGNILNENLDYWLLTSDENGYLQFDSEYMDGLDEGLYAIWEYEAPMGYTLNDRVYFIEISPEYDVTLKKFIGTDVNTTTADSTSDMTLVGGTAYSKTIGEDGKLDESERLINNYTITEYNSALAGTVDTEINPQDGAEYKAAAKYYWDGKADDLNKKVTATLNEGIEAIPNTKLTKLPSTGGIGTLIFTGAGLVLMGGALAGMKKKKEEDEPSEE